MSTNGPDAPLATTVPYSAATVWAAEGARVGAVTCSECGATLFLDPRDNVPATEIHERWHRELQRERLGRTR